MLPDGCKTRIFTRSRIAHIRPASVVLSAGSPAEYPMPLTFGWGIFLGFHRLPMVPD